MRNRFFILFPSFLRSRVLRIILKLVQFLLFSLQITASVGLTEELKQQQKPARMTDIDGYEKFIQTRICLLYICPDGCDSAELTTAAMNTLVIARER